MIGVHWLPLCASPPTSKLSANLAMSLSVSLGNEASLSSYLLNPKLCPKFYVKCCCINKEQPTRKASEDFSVLESDIPWDRGSVWSTLALYIFSLHIPLSFGGLAVVANVLHQPILDPQTEALSLLAIQTLELIAALWLLRFVVMPKVKIFSFFATTNRSKERNWLLASVLGFGFLILVVFFTSVLADQVIGPKAFHVYHISCLVHWILLCELEIYTKQLVEPKAKRKSRRKTKTKRNGSREESELSGLRKQIYSVFCPECQGTGINIDGYELEKPTVPLSEMFRYKIKVSDARRAWMKCPEVLQNCSTGFHFPSPSDELIQVLRLLIKLFYLGVGCGET